MNKQLIAVGIFLAAIWTGVTFISLGLPITVCNFLKQATFGFLSAAIANLHNGFHYDVANKDMPTVIFLILFSVAFIVYFALAVKISKRPTAKNSFVAVIVFSVLFRLLLLPSIPIHENDVYRYLWDGKVAKEGINPYKYAPAAVEALAGRKTPSAEQSAELTRLNRLRMTGLTFFSRIGHRWVPTIYPPFAQYIFFLAALVRQDSIYTMKGIFIIFDLLAILMIAKILVYFKKDPALAMIYGWSPLVLKEIANSAHYDSVSIFLLLLSLYLFCTKKHFFGSLGLALAGASKFFPIFLVPVYLKRIKWRNFVVFAVVLSLLFIPYFFWGHTGWNKVFMGLRIYAERWNYNGSLFVLLQSFLSAFNIKIFAPLFLARLIAAVIFVVWALYLSQQKPQDELALMRGSFVLLTLLFLLSPVADPWYFCWVIPFLCFFAYRSFLILSWLLIFSYLSFNHYFGLLRIGTFQFPVLNSIQYIPFFIVFIGELFLKRRNKLDYV